MTTAYDFLWSLDQRAKGGRLRLGQAVVRSVEGDPVFGTVTGQAMIVPASADWINNEALPAKYLSEYPPRPGAAVWYATDGSDVLILGMMSPEGPPAARLELAANTAIANDTLTVVNMSSILFDPWNTSNGVGVTVPVPGVYSVTGQVQFATDTGNVGFRALTIDAGSNSETLRYALGTVTQPSMTNTVGPYNLAKGDTIRVRVRQTSGGSLSVIGGLLRVTYVGRARSTVTSNILMKQIYPVSDPGWIASPSTTTVIYDADSGGTPLISSGSVVSPNTWTLYSPEVVPVVPGAKYVLGARTTTALSSGTGGVATQYLSMTMLCAANGVPDPNLATSSTATGTQNTRVASTVSNVQTNFGTLTIPDGCFTARLALQNVGTGTLKFTYWTNLSMTEVVS